MNYDYKNLRPFKWFVLQNFPFIEVDFDAITNWQLFSKLGEEINKVINSMNLTGEQVESLTNAFNNLETYVNNYFENLDIQEEVNEKLDEMAQSGQLAELISQYLESQAIIGFNTNTNLKNATNLANGSFARTYGKDIYTDGKGAFYKIRTRANEDVPDDDNIIALINTENLVAEKIYTIELQKINNVINQEKFKPTVFASMYMIDDNENTIKERILKWKKMGCKGIIVLINLNNDENLTVRDDLVKVKNLMIYAKENGLIVNTIKFHCNIDSMITTSVLTTYESQVNYVLNELNAISFGITRIAIFNELPHVYSYDASESIKEKAISIINNLKTNYSVGIPCSNLELGLGNMIEYSPNICNAVDYFAFNYYQTFPFKKELTNNNDSLIAWSESLDAVETYKKLYNKNIILSETGCLNNWLNMMNPSDYTLNQYPAEGKTYPIYFYGLFKNAIANTSLNELWLWYDEVMTNYDSVIKFFEYYLGGE